MKTPSSYSHLFTLNPDSNGGESVVLHTKFEDNGDFSRGLAKEPVLSATHELIINSYGNSVHFNMYGYLTPTVLRDLANQLEKAEVAAKIVIKNSVKA